METFKKGENKASGLLGVPELGSRRFKFYQLHSAELTPFVVATRGRKNGLGPKLNIRQPKGGYTSEEKQLSLGFTCNII